MYYVLYIYISLFMYTYIEIASRMLKHVHDVHCDVYRGGARSVISTHRCGRNRSRSLSGGGF